MTPADVAARLRSTGRRPLALAAATLVLAATLTACGEGGSGSRPPQARPSEPTSQDFGPVELHYNALRTDELTPDVARAYGIERSPGRVLLNVSMLGKLPEGRTAPLDGTVTASAHNLNGQLKDLQMRRVQEGTSVYFIGEVGISGNEILVFDIDATPNDGSGHYTVQFKREFYAD